MLRPGAVFALVLLVFLSPVFADGDPPAPVDQPAKQDPPPEAKEPPKPDELRPREPKVATDKDAKHELTVFEKDFDTPDVDFRLEALHRLSKCVHEDVMKRLLVIAGKDPDVYVRADAVKGLSHQSPFKSKIIPKLMPMLSDNDLDAKIQAEAILTLGVFRWTRAWEAIAELIADDDDVVVVAALKVLGEWKELRGCRAILEFWEVYPEEGKWSTGSVTVDTGSAGDEDARAAKAKWMGRYGNKGKQRARAECVKAIKAAVKNLTGEEMEKVADFRQWCSDHKAEIKAAERRRD
jgi:HEAT repeat protein